MSIVRKVRGVEKLFKTLDHETNIFTAKTGIHCLAGCGKCCTKPNIEASPLEYLPLAYEWFRQGIAEEKYVLLKENIPPVCINYSPLSTHNLNSGSCNSYNHRGLTCRLFGNAVSMDKHGKPVLVTCRLIKENQKEEVAMAINLLNISEYVPVFSDYYKKLYQIDFRLASKIVPINEAILLALEEVMSYYAYRPFTSGKKAG